ncbi:hypothetical protein GCM10027293_15160 [Pontibacter aydingkolensis]
MLSIADSNFILFIRDSAGGSVVAVTGSLDLQADKNVIAKAMQNRYLYSIVTRSDSLTKLRKQQAKV